MTKINTVINKIYLASVMLLITLLATTFMSPGFSGSQVQAAANSPLRITEIMFDPSGDGSKEFLEIYNGSNTTVSLAGWSTYGVDYVFSSGVSLSPGGYLVIARNQAALRATYPSANIVGQYGGKLKGGGELVRLLDSGGNVMSSVYYTYGGAWPSAPKDGGPSLSLIRATANESSSSCWAPSSALGGSPSVGNSVQGGYGGGCADSPYLTVSSGGSSGGGSGSGSGAGSANGSASDGSAGSSSDSDDPEQAKKKKKQQEKKKQEQKQKEQEQQEQAEEAARIQQSEQQNRKNSRLWWGLGLAAVLVIAGLVGWLLTARILRKRQVSTILSKGKGQKTKQPKKPKQPKKKTKKWFRK